MTYILRNKILEIFIDHPLKNYKAPRFDWTGKVSEVRFIGNPMTITEKPTGENEQLFGKGLYNEFGIDTALGFEDVKIGDWFHKIGVGLLKKDEASYKFHHNYEVKPAEFEITVSADRVNCVCFSENYNGFSYQLVKEIILHDDQLIIDYSLKNTGEKNILTDEYVHNFLGFNRQALSNHYNLTFPFQLDQNKFEKIENPENLISINSNTITFKSALNEQFLLTHLGGKKEQAASWELVHTIEKIGVRETASFPTNKINLWGWKHVISPELFHQIELLPNESTNWSRTYQFFITD